MLTKNLKTFLLSLLFLMIIGQTNPTMATTPTTTEESDQEIDENTDEANETDEEETSEIEKCKILKTKLLGKNFDPKRIAVTTILVAANLPIFIKLLLGIRARNMKSVAGYALYEGASMLLFIKLLLKYECNTSPITYSGPIGILLYALFNRFELCSNLEEILKTYDAEKTPDCVKQEFNALVEEYKANDNHLEMNQNDKIEFIDMILAQLHEIINSEKK